jgi:hypothetical protein
MPRPGGRRDIRVRARVAQGRGHSFLGDADLAHHIGQAGDSIRHDAAQPHLYTRAWPPATAPCC